VVTHDPATEPTTAIAANLPPEALRQNRYSPPPGATRILLVRHGATEAAVPGVMFPLKDGHGDPGLEPLGFVQAEQVCARLAAEHKAGQTINAIYVTTLQRTHQTAAPLVAAIGIEPRVEADLREVFLGDWEGGEVRIRAAQGDPIYEQAKREQRWDILPGAEPGPVFEARLRAGISRITAAHPGGRVVAVVHGGVIGQVLATAAHASKGFAMGGAENGSISEIVVETDGAWRIRRFNDTAHLDLAPVKTA
jgi:2,3-bisphosphoglycerate-dependent phosphoglycerate mutase